MLEPLCVSELGLDSLKVPEESEVLTTSVPDIVYSDVKLIYFKF